MSFPSVPFSFLLMPAGTLGDNLDWQSGKAFGLFFHCLGNYKNLSLSVPSVDEEKNINRRARRDRRDFFAKGHRPKSILKIS
jgi:hypothetical protein